MCGFFVVVLFWFGLVFSLFGFWGGDSFLFVFLCVVFKSAINC